MAVFNRRERGQAEGKQKDFLKKGSLAGGGLATYP